MKMFVSMRRVSCCAYSKRRSWGSLDEHTFEQDWRDWFERNLKNGTWTDIRQYWHDKYAERYFKRRLYCYKSSRSKAGEICKIAFN